MAWRVGRIDRATMTGPRPERAPHGAVVLREGAALARGGGSCASDGFSTCRPGSDRTSSQGTLLGRGTTSVFDARPYFRAAAVAKIRAQAGVAPDLRRFKWENAQPDASRSHQLM